MSSLASPSAGRSPPPAASALLERHGAALRLYLGQLPGADAARIERVLQQLGTEGGGPEEPGEDPVVGLFARARLRVTGTGQRAEVLRAGTADAAEDEEAGDIQDSRVAVHRAFGRLTSKQQEALRLKIQFGFSTEELARITGLTPAGAAGLLQHAMSRVVQAMPAGPGRTVVRPEDPRVIAYALDEMRPGEKKAFVESMPDGKVLLETVELIRRAARELTQILQNGAPPPRRQRARRGGGWWRRWVAAGGVLLLVAGAAWWRIRNPGQPVGPSAGTLERTESRPTRADAADRPEDGDRETEAAAVRRPERKKGLRPGEAEWERKPFGRGTGLAAGQTGGGAAVAAGGFSPMTGGGSGGPSGASDPGWFSREEGDNPPVVIRPPASGAAGTAGSGAGGVASVAGTDVSGQAASAVAAAPVPAPAGSAAPASRVPVPPKVSGLQDLRHALGRRQWPRSGQVVPGALLRLAPPERMEPDGQPEPLAVRMESAPSPFAPERHVVRVVVQARPVPPPARAPANLVLAIDVSESMRAPNRLPLVQAGVRLLAERLRPDDRVAIVTYAAEAREVRTGEPIGEGGRGLRDALAGLPAEGRTNGYEGLVLAYAAALRTRTETGLNAVILCTDGNFNLGETDSGTLAALAARFAAEGIRLSVFGFGRSDRNDLRLELLAQQGGGGSCYVNTSEEAERLLAGQIEGLLEPVARDVAWRVDFDPERVAEVRPLAGTDDGPVAELLPGRSLTALYELTLHDGAAAAPGGLGEVRVDFLRAAGPEPGRLQRRLEAPGAAWDKTGPGFRFAVALAELERILQAGPGEAAPALERLEVWTGENLPDDAGGYRQELLATIVAAREAAAVR